MTWEPGDPLYDRPEGVFHNQQHVRELFEVIDTEDFVVQAFCNTATYRSLVRCVDCLVAWHPSEGRGCWSCGKPVKDYEYRRALRSAA